MNVWDNVPEVTRIIQESTTYDEVFQRLSISDRPLHKLLHFMKVHGVKMKPWTPPNRVDK